MRFLFFLLAISTICFAKCANAETSAPHMIVVVGASGQQQFEETFSEAAGQIASVAKASGTAPVVIGPSKLASSANIKSQNNKLVTDKDLLQNAIKNIPQDSLAVWIIMIGHGTMQQNVAKFNLRGRDVSAGELKSWCESVKAPMVFVNASSASAPFINALSGKNRVIVTATKTGNEQNYSRFGKYFAEALGSPTSDLDHDDETSVLEAFLKASSDVKQFYASEGRISTEHALIDDNGDNKGTPAKVFKGTRNESGAAKSKLDGNLAKRMTLSSGQPLVPFTVEQLAQREKIENQLSSLSDLPLDERLAASEALFIELAKLYASTENQE